MAPVPLVGQPRGRFCYFCKQSSPGSTLSLSKVFICETCYHSVRSIPCFSCQSTIWPVVALSGDERFPIWQVVLGFCEKCKQRYYLEHRNELQQQYQEWLETHYPTPSLVYALRDPRDHRIYYIGRTHDLHERIQSHRRGKRDCTERGFWLQSLDADGLTFEYEILERCEPGYRAFEQEVRWIAHGLLRYPLTNHEAHTQNGRRITNAVSVKNCFTCDIYDLVTGTPFRATRRVRRFAAWANRMPKALLDNYYDFPRKNPEIYD